MAYISSHKASLTIRYSLSRYAKRVTLKVEDMRLLRQLWKLIDPSSAIGNDTPENTRQKELKVRLERRKVKHKVARMWHKVNQLKAIHRDTYRLT